MNRTCRFGTLALLFVGTHAVAVPITVNCDRGGSINHVLALLPRGMPSTVTVNGTCTEYVVIRGLQDLTVRSSTGASLVRPIGNSQGSCLFKAALTIEASRRVTIDGLRVQASDTGYCSGGVFVRSGSADVRLRNLTVEGGNQGISIAENSQVSLAGVTGRDSSWAAVAVFDGSSLHIEDSLFDGSTGPGWHEGIVAIKGVATLHGTRISNMQVGLDAQLGGIIDLSEFGTYSPAGGPTDVVVESPAGTGFWGVSVGGGSSFNAGVKLRITTPGQAWGGDTAGVKVSDASSFTALGNLEISASQGQGVVVTNNSFANLPGAIISGTGHSGLVVINNSSANLDAFNVPLTPITGSGTPDLFCDATSLITGVDKAPGSTRQCDHVVGGSFGPLP